MKKIKVSCYGMMQAEPLLIALADDGKYSC